MNGLTFGLQLPVQAQSTLFAQPWERDAGPAEIAAVAQACDAHGFGYVAVCDHVAIPREHAPRMTTTWYDTVATLGWLAGITRRVKLLSHVYVVAYRHPLLTAKAFATLDALSGGRAVLGVGAGHLEGEFALLGVPFAERGRRTDEAVRAVRAKFADEWGGGDGGQRPRPVQPGGPPIWIGGSSPAAIDRAARLGDGWLPQGPPPEGTAAAVAALRARLAAAGRADAPFVVGGGMHVYVGVPHDGVPERAVTGEPEKIAALLRAEAELGVTHVQLSFPVRGHEELVDQIAAFAHEVMPLAGGGGEG
ncbi:TIGR03619 family F420-dependent LLM class oxidoreductase [Actinomadura chibensis]|uniref:TIGR03619 family F420-dependent LLM class oxidoreductase n=1 Tax=Actinomadura chibensis TaxID=392828 RepID=A0A5D0ND22_9ACTN|nr:TIGR03619 family F420-dependent LLM class oxidoreductase [Actinomadura chibensis]TYB42330.1 TIGR03619 family F420-dependent LLM class oxidoreductase [Actinomadura chibensis]